ncbi:hypothetical protein V490_05210 [Pseudogymnoascus sp. VKM F-3557]|nr:hypothetical protein V490_05210 [Pseudogymnoascus sp. VKM F-3557]
MANKPDDNSTSLPPPTSPPSAPGPSRSRDQTDGTEASESQSSAKTARNKLLAYSSSYRGAWALMRCEDLEMLAKSNWALPPPRAIDPALFFDLVNIRKLVEEATDLSVRATAGIATSALSTPFTRAQSLKGSGAERMGLGLGLYSSSGTDTELSPKRKLQMRSQATQKLSRAYQLDELSSSLVTTQGASILESVAEQVIGNPRENIDPLDGKYVHYFHEKIDTKSLENPQKLKPLDEVISGRKMSAEPLRTRAVALMHQERYKTAVQDLTRALEICKFHERMHIPEPRKSQNTGSLGAGTSDSSKGKEVKLDEGNYPSSLKPQLSFYRACAYLGLACQSIDRALPPKGDKILPKTQGSSQGVSNEGDRGGLWSEEDLEAMERANQGRMVKDCAKRALQDYLEYFSNLDFTPELDPKHMEVFVRKVHQVASGSKGQGGTNSNRSLGIPPPVVYPISRLFDAVQPIGLPSDPQTDILVDHSSAPKNKSDTSTPYSNSSASDDMSGTSTTGGDSAPEDPSGTSALHEAAQQLLDSTNKQESLTYHPLLVEALHCLLLCHVLMQTSIRELQRHAHMAARLIRSCDGYPIFGEPTMVPAREDWIQILGRVGDKYALDASWEVLCRPRLYRRGGIPPIFNDEEGNMKETKDEKRDRLHKEAVLETLRDKSIADNETFKKALADRQRRQEEEERSTGKMDEHHDGKEHNVSSIRARRIVRWIQEAPPVRNKRKPKGGGSAGGSGSLDSPWGFENF